MSRTVGKASSGIWFLIGALCMMLFGARTASAQAEFKYGVRPKPGLDQLAPPADPEEVKAASALVEKYLGPVEAQPPTEEQQKQIAEALKGLAADDQAARDAAAKTLAGIGPAALGALREVAAKQDQPNPASAAVKQIEAAARAQVANELKSKGRAGLLAITEKSRETIAGLSSADAALNKAKAEGDAKAIAQAREAMAKWDAQGKMIQQLNETMYPPLPVPVALYGVRARPPEQAPVPPNPGPVAKYGVRANPPPP